MFADLLVLLILKSKELGFEITLGELFRSPEEAERLANLGVGIKNSLHTVGLAIDVNLFKNGVYLKTTKSHLELGEWWEQQHELCRWGGRFGDGNHYSITHGGRK